jgi:hypothetical protein
MDHFAQHVRKYEMAGCILEEVDWKSCSFFSVLIFAFNSKDEAQTALFKDPVRTAL